MPFEFSIRFPITIALFVGISLAPLAQSQEPERAAGSRNDVADDLTQTASWQVPDSVQLHQAFEEWLSDSNAKAETANRIGELLDAEFQQQSAVEMLDLVVDGIVIARPDVNQLREALRKQRSGARPPDFSQLIDNPQEKQFLRDHVRLYYGRWLAQNEFYDESLEQLSSIELKDVLDPATLLFYRGLMQHQLLKKDECLKTIGRLLENSSELPRRFEVLSRLMLADLKPMEPDSLDEISRLMNDIRRRTGLFRSGKLVLEEEAQVIKKLDKLIEELEAQQRSQQASNNVAPSSPMKDSFKAGGKGSGDVTSKRQTEGGDWGDLPPADRAAALAEMAKDMPPHYRAVIEEYFRQLAREQER